MKESLIIACDGEAASGKSTGAKLISKKYKLLLINSGLLYRYASKLIIEHNPKNQTHLSDKTFVFSGSLKNFSRMKAKDMITKRGAKTAAGVSKKTDYVVAGENPGSKIRKAKELNIPIINEQEFLKIINIDKN